jgi:hypothetical protein
VPFTGGKSYGMHNYAKNYRTWTPQHRPQKQYRDSFQPFADSQAHDGGHADVDSNEYEDSVTESTPFGNEIQAIDDNAKRYGNSDKYDRRKGNIWNRDRQQDHLSMISYKPDSAVVETRVKGYSTLPHEIINSPISPAGHDIQYSSAADQDFREFKIQNPSEVQGFRVFENHNAGHGQQFRFNNQNFRDGQESRLRNQNQNSGNRQELRFNVPNFPAEQGKPFSVHNFGNGQSPAGRDGLRYNTQPVGGTRELQYNIQISHTGHESGLRNQNFVGEHNPRYNIQNFSGRYNDQNSVSGVHSNQAGFPLSHGNANNNHPDIQTVHNFGEAVNFRPTADDLYHKAFRSFSFGKTPSHSSSKDQSDSFSGAGFNNKPVLQTSSPSYQSGTAHSKRENNQWFNGRTGPNKDHDIGFFEGLEDINDAVGN